MKIHEYNQMMKRLQRPATPKAVARKPKIKVAAATDKQQEAANKLIELEKKKMQLDPLYIPDIIDPELLEDELLLESSLGNVEQDLADEYWHSLYDDYLDAGGTLDFKEWLKIELEKSSKVQGIKSILRI